MGMLIAAAESWELAQATPPSPIRIRRAESLASQDRYAAYLINLGYPPDRRCRRSETPTEALHRVVHRWRW
jgi:hypothetical protein